MPQNIRSVKLPTCILLHLENLLMDNNMALLIILFALDGDIFQIFDRSLLNIAINK